MYDIYIYTYMSNICKYYEHICIYRHKLFTYSHVQHKKIQINYRLHIQQQSIQELKTFSLPSIVNVSILCVEGLQIQDKIIIILHLLLMSSKQYVVQVCSLIVVDSLIQSNVLGTQWLCSIDISKFTVRFSQLLNC